MVEGQFLTYEDLGWLRVRTGDAWEAALSFFFMHLTDPLLLIFFRFGLLFVLVLLSMFVFLWRRWRSRRSLPADGYHYSALSKEATCVQTVSRSTQDVVAFG